MAKRTLIQARHKSHFSRRIACLNLRVGLDKLKSWEYYREEVPDKNKKQIADSYGTTVDEISWHSRQTDDVSLASQMLGISKQTLRLYLQQGEFGTAIKGMGTQYVYSIDWKKVEEWEESKKW